MAQSSNKITVKISSPGPRGPAGPQASPAGEDGAIQYNNNGVFSAAEGINYRSGSSTFEVTGSLTVSGSNTFKVIGPTILSTLQITGTSGLQQGLDTTVVQDYGAAQGYQSDAKSAYSHAEGYNTRTFGEGAHAEGESTLAYGNYSHTEGAGTRTTGESSHAEGVRTVAKGTGSHAEGKDTEAYGDYSHAEGNSTQAYGQYQTVVGQYNKLNNTTDLFVVGGGTSTERRDTFAVRSGSVIVSGSVSVSGSIFFPDLPFSQSSYILVFDTQSKQIYYTASAAVGAGSVTPGGSNTQIQFNNGGLFGGVPNLTWDSTTLRATGSFTGSFTGSLFGTASWARNSVTASFSVTSSFALTASYTPNAIITASINPANSNVIEFTKGNGSTFSLTVATGSGGGGGGAGGGTLKNVTISGPGTLYPEVVSLVFSGSNFTGSGINYTSATIQFKPNNGAGSGVGQIQYAGSSDNFIGSSKFTYINNSLATEGLGVNTNSTSTSPTSNADCAIKVISPATDFKIDAGHPVGKMFMIKNGIGTSLPIEVNGGGTINGGSPYSLENNASIIVVHFGSNEYHIMAKYTP